MTNINRLPEDLKLLIIEYIPASDFSTLQLVSREFYQLFQRKPSLWAKQIFSCIIQAPNKSLNEFKYELSAQKMFIPREIEFNHFIEAKDLWKCGAINKNKFIKFIDNQTEDHESSVAFVDRIINTLIDPPLPEPVLKKEIYYFPTSSKFQNFLTELFYDIIPSLKNDPNQNHLNSICEKITELNQNSDSLINLRWYNFSEIQISDDILSQLLVNFNDLIQSHCNAIQGYVSHIEDELNQLKEYNRCWKEFAFSVIELDKLMKPLNLLVNNIYSKKYPNHPQYPEFSVWRLMVKLWYGQVYGPLAEKLKGAYKKFFMDSLMKKLKQSDISPSKLYEINMELQHFEHTTCIEEEEEDSKVEKAIKMIRKHLIALEDLSLNEFTVFYHDCENNDKSSPKTQLINSIADDLKQFAVTLFHLVAEDKNEFKIVFNNLQDSLSALLDERSIYEVMMVVYDSFAQNLNKSEKCKIKDSEIIGRMGDELEKQKSAFNDLSYQRESQGHYKIEEGFEVFFNHYNTVKADQIAIFSHA